MTSRLLRIKMAVAGILGHRCAGCGRRGRWPWEKPLPKNDRILEVNHKNGRPYSIRRLHRHTRWLRYLHEALGDEVEAMCGPCNRSHGTRLRYSGPVDKTRQGQPRRLRKQYQEGRRDADRRSTCCARRGLLRLRPPGHYPAAARAAVGGRGRPLRSDANDTVAGQVPPRPGGRVGLCGGCRPAR